MKSKVGFFYQNESWKQKLNKMFSILELPLWLQMTLLCLQPWTRAMPLPLVSALGSHHHHIFRKRAAPVHALCPHCNKLFPLSSHDQISEKVLAHFRTLDSYASRSLEQERRWKKNKETRGRTRDISSEKKKCKSYILYGLQCLKIGLFIYERKWDTGQWANPTYRVSKVQCCLLLSILGITAYLCSWQHMTVSKPFHPQLINVF